MRLALAAILALTLLAIASGAAQRRRHPRHVDIRLRTYQRSPDGVTRYVREWRCICGEPVFV